MTQLGREQDAVATTLGAGIRELITAGPGGLSRLLEMRAEPSWAVRRQVIVALGEIGEPALGPLCQSLLEERADETLIAATVDALVASRGDVEAALGALREGRDAAVLADVAQVLGRRRNPASVPILAELSRDPDDNVAVASIEALGRIGGRAVVDLLVEAVEQRHFFRTFAAIDVLGKSGDPRAIAPLAALLDSPQYSFEAARALGHSRDLAAVAPLAQLLGSEDPAQVRVAAVALVGLQRGHGERVGSSQPLELALGRAAPRAVAACVSRSFDGADDTERAALLAVLGWLRDEAAIPILLRELDGPALIARAAAEALDRIGNASDQQLAIILREGSSARRQVVLPTISRAGAAQAIVLCLSDPDVSVRRLACDALGRIGNALAVPALFEALADSSAAVVQAATSAIQSLGYAGTPALALQAAGSASASVRRAALRILAYFGRSEALGVFDAASRDADPRVRDAAILGLSLLEDAGAFERLLELASDALPATRASALRALGDCPGDARAVAHLRRGLADPEPWVRYYAIQSLGKLRAEPSVEEIAALVSDPAGQVRVAAIEALSHLPGETAFGALRRAAGSTELDLQRAALIGLGLSGRAEAAECLLQHADSSDAATRLMTLSALSSFETAEALAAVNRAVHDADESIKTAAIGFLGLRSGTEATRLLVGLLKDPALGERAFFALTTPREHRVAGLLSALRRADDELAFQITTVLARLDQAEATAALFEALTLPSAAARKAAATTLGAGASREAAATLQRLSVEDSDAEVRHVCALLLARHA